MNHSIVGPLIATILFVAVILGLQYRFLVYPFYRGLKRYPTPLNRKEEDPKLGKVRIVRHHLTQQLMISKWPTQNRDGLSVKSIDGGDFRYYLEFLYLHTKEEQSVCPQTFSIEMSVETLHGKAQQLTVPLETMGAAGYELRTYMGSPKKSWLMLFLMGYNTQGRKPRLLARGQMTEEQVQQLADATSITLASKEVKLLAASDKFVDATGKVLLNRQHFGSYPTHLKQLIASQLKSWL